MQLGRKQLFSLRVMTERGLFIGKVVDIQFDTEGQHIVQYEIQPRFDIQALLKSLIVSGRYLVHRNQVVKITNKELIIQDGCIPALEKNLKLLPSQDPALDPMSMQGEA